jgi:hypothetical protein
VHPYQRGRAWLAGLRLNGWKGMKTERLVGVARCGLIGIFLSRSASLQEDRDGYQGQQHSNKNGAPCDYLYQQSIRSPRCTERLIVCCPLAHVFIVCSPCSFSRLRQLLGNLFELLKLQLLQFAECHKMRVFGVFWHSGIYSSFSAYRQRARNPISEGARRSRG